MSYSSDISYISELAHMYDTMPLSLNRYQRSSGVTDRLLLDIRLSASV